MSREGSRGAAHSQATKSLGATVRTVGAVPESLYYSLIVVLPPEVASQWQIDKRIRYALSVCVCEQWRGKSIEGVDGTGILANCSTFHAFLSNHLTQMMLI